MRDKPGLPHGSRGGRETARGSVKERGPQTQSGPCLWYSCCLGITGFSSAAWGELSLGESQRGPLDLVGEPGWSLEAALTSGNQGETMGALKPFPLSVEPPTNGGGLSMVMKIWGLGAGAQGSFWKS